MHREKIYHIVPGKDGNWDVKEEGRDEPLATYRTQQEAVENAKTRAEEHKPGSFVVHDTSGEPRYEHTYR